MWQAPHLARDKTLGAPSMNKVLRDLKRQEHSLFNCIASILADAHFVAEIVRTQPTLPVVANLRCGGWYVPRPDATCYFKSTDGHHGAWAFSLTRLNWHVALLAASRGGAFLVDATRRGKTFPDALTKTVPLWAAVVNRAVARCRHQQNRDKAANARGHRAPAWDTALHLPLWIGLNEREQIEARLADWTEQLTCVGVDLEGLAAVLSKPLRPLWLGHNSRVLPPEQQPALDDLPFTPLYLVSASEPNVRHRIVPGPHRGAPDGLVAEPTRGEGDDTASFQYVPGAGDDEETWSRGLTPSLLWMHEKQLIGAGPAGVAAAVAQLKASQSQQPAAGRSPLADQPQHTVAPSRTHSGSATAASQRQQQSLPSPSPSPSPSLRDSHPPPQGLVQQVTPTASTRGAEETALGIYPIGTLGLNIACLPELDTSIVTRLWQAADAVLDIGTVPHAALGGLVSDPSSSASSDAHGFSTASIHGATNRQYASSASHSRAATESFATEGSTDVCHAAYVWLPIPQPKQVLLCALEVESMTMSQDKVGLLRALPDALRRIEGCLRKGQRIIIHSTAGTELPLCIALAGLLAFCVPLPSGGWCPSWLQPHQSDTCKAPVTDRTKAEFRRALAFVSACCPEARPSARMLKQVSIALHVGGCPPPDRPRAPRGNLKHQQTCESQA